MSTITEYAKIIGSHGFEHTGVHAYVNQIRKVDEYTGAVLDLFLHYVALVDGEVGTRQNDLRSALFLRNDEGHPFTYVAFNTHDGDRPTFYLNEKRSDPYELLALVAVMREVTR